MHLQYTLFRFPTLPRPLIPKGIGCARIVLPLERAEIKRRRKRKGTARDVGWQSEGQSRQERKGQKAEGQQRGCAFRDNIAERDRGDLLTHDYRCCRIEELKNNLKTPQQLEK